MISVMALSSLWQLTRVSWNGSLVCLMTYHQHVCRAQNELGQTQCRPSLYPLMRVHSVSCMQIWE